MEELTPKSRDISRTLRCLCLHNNAGFSTQNGNCSNPSSMHPQFPYPFITRTFWDSFASPPVVPYSKSYFPLYSLVRSLNDEESHLQPRSPLQFSWLVDPCTQLAFWDYIGMEMRLTARNSYSHWLSAKHMPRSWPTARRTSASNEIQQRWTYCRLLLTPWPCFVPSVGFL